MGQFIGSQVHSLVYLGTQITIPGACRFVGLLYFSDFWYKFCGQQLTVVQLCVHYIVGLFSTSLSRCKQKYHIASWLAISPTHTALSVSQAITTSQLFIRSPGELITHFLVQNLQIHSTKVLGSWHYFALIFQKLFQVFRYSQSCFNFNLFCKWWWCTLVGWSNRLMLIFNCINWQNCSIQKSGACRLEEHFYRGNAVMYYIFGLVTLKCQMLQLQCHLKSDQQSICSVVVTVLVRLFRPALWEPYSTSAAEVQHSGLCGLENM